MIRFAVVFLVTALAVTASILAMGVVHDDANRARDAETAIVKLEVDVLAAKDIPWGATPDEADTTRAVRDELAGALGGIDASLARLQRDAALPGAGEILAAWKQAAAAHREIFRLSAAGRGDDTGEASETAAVQTWKVVNRLEAARGPRRAAAVDALERQGRGTAAVVILVALLFLGFYVRSVLSGRRACRLAKENARLLDMSREEALTDALTGLSNRRALVRDLEARTAAGERVMLALFDLDGFKHYNDTFGHPAGDALLSRLGERLVSTLEGLGTAYRMGGDEFCVIAPVTDSGASIAALAASALTDAGVGFSVGCSYGAVVVPEEVSDVEDALRVVDQRMYERKGAGRKSPGRQSADVLLELLSERHEELGGHIRRVATLARLTAQGLGVDDAEVERITLAAELHDVGKAAVPDAIVDKRGPLDAAEWEFMRRHTLIGERIIRAAPSLSDAAGLVRASHERIDGGGYPDGLAGEEIPLGARVVAVCDAFDAMTSPRPYRSPVSDGEALAELQRCAGTQFDRDVVDAFAGALARTAEPAS